MTITRKQRDGNRRSIRAFLERPPGAARTSERLDFDWRPQPFTPGRRRQAPFRWPVLFITVAAGVALAVGFRVIATSGAGSGGADQLVVALDAVDIALGDYDAAPTEETLGDLRTAVSVLSTLVATPPRGLGEDAARLASASAEGERAVERLLGAEEYRTAAESILAAPPLPTSVPEELLANIETRLLEMETETRIALDRVTPLADFNAYRSAVGEALLWLTDWRERYLLALSRADEAEAQARVAEFRVRIEEVASALADGIATAGGGSEDALETLRSTARDARARLGAG